MERVVLVVVLVGVAAVVAALLQRRRPDPPTQPGWAVPAQLDRRDFDEPSAPWLVVLFSSATCDTCAATRSVVSSVAAPEVAVVEAEVGERRDLHERYGIDAVPLVVVADEAGVVRASFVGPVSRTDLATALVELRNPGSGQPVAPPTP